jgi:hypothetical protein
VEIAPFKISGVNHRSRILLVDDICGSGRTLDAVRAALTRVSPFSIFSITLCRNAGSASVPNMWIWSVRDWVVFPWESAPDDIATAALPLPQKVTLAE